MFYISRTISPDWCVEPTKSVVKHTRRLNQNPKIVSCDPILPKYDEVDQIPIIVSVESAIKSNHINLLLNGLNFVID